MTNTEIIFKNRELLAEMEVLKVIDGIPEEILSCKEWNRRGFAVKKGEHAIAKFPIWYPKKKKYEPKKQEEDQEQEQQEQLKGFYMKVTAFFTADQVETIKKG